MACATGNYQIVDVRWKTWGMDNRTFGEATGTGVATWNDCNPTCTSGDEWTRDPVRIWLYGIANTPQGPRFTTLDMEPMINGSWSPFNVTQSVYPNGLS